MSLKESGNSQSLKSKIWIWSGGKKLRRESWTSEGK